MGRQEDCIKNNAAYREEYREWEARVDAFYNRRYTGWNYTRAENYVLSAQPKNPVKCEDCKEQPEFCMCEDEWCCDYKTRCMGFYRHSECCGKEHKEEMARYEAEDTRPVQFTKTGKPKKKPMNADQKRCRAGYSRRRRETQVNCPLTLNLPK